MTIPTSGDFRARFDALLDEHRMMLHDSLNGLTEDEVRRSLVPSATTLLGIVRHVTFAERVWFDQDISGRSRAEIGLPESVEDSWVLAPEDTIASIQAAHRHACDESREVAATLDLDTEVRGRTPHPLWTTYLHLLRELAQHCGHAEILREQILAAR
ncbi:DinB family protein [Williamsia sp. MIQD14]|uniref:DinB family protein n=1 Tax=Williamsia sp. MIQD14 TaxID=3425703 RepID=UPI003DA0FA47